MQPQAYVSIDLHRRRSVIVRRSREGETLSATQVMNDDVLAFSAAVTAAGEHPEVVIEACYGWYWAVDLLRLGRLAEAWIAPKEVRELRELVRHRAKLVSLRTNCKLQVYSVLAKEGVHVPMTDLFGVAGTKLLESVPLASAYAARVESLRNLIESFDREIAIFERDVRRELTTPATTPSRRSPAWA
ncbi:MAG: hypothetical protein M0020_02785 [Actinomycetota bacterium]|nr:hypothetical protein [Actinomycetota bacterium]